MALQFGLVDDPVATKSNASATGPAGTVATGGAACSDLGNVAESINSTFPTGAGPPWQSSVNNGPGPFDAACSFWNLCAR